MKASKPYKRRMQAREIDAMFARFHAENPTPKGELHSRNHYTLLIAVVLSAQATDKSVNQATQALFARVETPESMVALGEEALQTYIRTIGLYRTKAKNVIKLSQALIEQHGSQVPRTRAELEKLPGVGRKTANVVLNSAFGVPTIAVDTHLFRVSNRMGLAPGDTVLDVEQALLKRIPKAWHQHAHHWLILHGRYRCTARKPDCAHCIVHEWCQYREKS